MGEDDQGVRSSKYDDSEGHLVWLPHGDGDNNEDKGSSLRSILISKRSIHNSSLARLSSNSK